MAKRYSIRYTIDDAQPRASVKAAMSAAKALESQYLRAAKAAEAVVAAQARLAKAAMVGGGGTGGNAMARVQADAEVMIGAARRVTTEKVRAYTQAEASAKAHEQALRAINRRMVADAAAAVTTAPAPRVPSAVNVAALEAKRARAAAAAVAVNAVAPESGAGDLPGRAFLDRARVAAAIRKQRAERDRLARTADAFNAKAREYSGPGYSESQRDFMANRAVEEKFLSRRADANAKRIREGIKTGLPRFAARPDAEGQTLMFGDKVPVPSLGGQAAAQKAAAVQVQALGKVTAAAGKAATAVGFVTQAPEGPGLKTVMADLDKLHASLAKDKSYYVAPGGTGAKPGAYQNVSTFLDKAKKERTAVDQPRVGVSGGEAFVDDGRTRLARLKELGVRRFPVSVPEESAAEFERLFGAAGRGSLERQARAAQLRAERAARLAAMVPPRPPGAGMGIAAAGGAEDKEPTVDVGLHKLQIDALKVTERRAADARKLAEKEAAEYDRIQERKARADDRAADRKARAAQQAAERAGKTAEKEAADYDRNQQRAARAADREADRKVRGAEKAAERARKQAEKDAADHDRRAAAQQARDDKAADLKVARAQQAAEREAKAAQKKAADVSAVETKFAARDYQARVAMEAKKEQQAERDAAAAVKRAERQARQEESNALGPYGRVAKIKRAALSEEQLQQAANAKQADAIHNRRINQILKERGVGQDNFRSSIADALGLEAAFSKAGVALAAIGAGKMAFQVVTAAMAEARQASEAMARQVLDTAGSLREIALLRGLFAPTEAEVQRHIDLRKASGLTHEEAVGFETEILNQLGTISEEKFPDLERKKLSTEGARMAARGGGGITAITNRAKMIGMLPDFVKAGAGGQVQSRDVMAMADAVDRINAMSRASNAVSAAQSAELISALTTEDMKGTFQDPRKAVALSTIAAKFEPGASANVAMQAIRQGRGFTKFRKMKGTEAAQGETLRLAKITEQMDPAQTLTKLFEFAQKEMKPDEAFDAFLARRGFRDQTGNMRLAQFFNEFRKGNFQRIMAEAEKPLDVTAPGRKFAAFAVSDVGRDLMGKAAIDAAKLERGKLSTELELRTQEVTPAFVAAGGIDTTPAIIAATVVGRGDAERGRKAMLQREAVRNARQAAGVAPGLGLGTIGGLGMAATTAALAPFLGPAAPQVGLYGGAAAGYYSGENAEIVRELKRIADSNELMLKQDQQKKAQAKPQPLPPPQPLRGRADVPARH